MHRRVERIGKAVGEHPPEALVGQKTAYASDLPFHCFRLKKPFFLRRTLVGVRLRFVGAVPYLLFGPHLETQFPALHHVGMTDPGLRVGLAVEPNTLDILVNGGVVLGCDREHAARNADFSPVEQGRAEPVAPSRRFDFVHAQRREHIPGRHLPHERAVHAANIINERRGWVQSVQRRDENIQQISEDCIAILKAMPEFDWETYSQMLNAKGYDIKLIKDDKEVVKGYAIRKGNSIYKSSILGKSRKLMPSKIEATWVGLHASDKQTAIQSKEVCTQTMAHNNKEVMPQSKPSIYHYSITVDGEQLEVENHCITEDSFLQNQIMTILHLANFSYTRYY